MKHKGQKGQAIVEFCVVLPLLLILLAGIIEFSLIMYDKAVITNASREGARAGIVAQTPRKTASEVQAIVNNYLTNNLITFRSSTPAVTVEATSSSPTINDTLTVTVHYTYGYLVIPNFISSGSGIAMNARTIMRYE
jgi:Flp pilus assembly protein TadG